MSGKHRGQTWEPVPPAVGCGQWFGLDTIRAAHWAAPTAPLSDLEGGEDKNYTTRYGRQVEDLNTKC